MNERLRGALLEKGGQTSVGVGECVGETGAPLEQNWRVGDVDDKAENELRGISY